MADEKELEKIAIPKLDYERDLTLEGQAQQLRTLYNNVNYLREQYAILINKQHQMDLKELEKNHKMLTDFTKIVKDEIKPLRDDFKCHTEKSEEKFKIYDDRFDDMDDEEERRKASFGSRLLESLKTELIKWIALSIISLLTLSGLVDIVLRAIGR